MFQDIGRGGKAANIIAPCTTWAMPKALVGLPVIAQRGNRYRKNSAPRSFPPGSGRSTGDESVKVRADEIQ